MAEKTERERARRVIAENRKARHDYHVLETWEVGIALLGTEVKAIREGRVNLRDSYARVENGEVWLLNVHISPYSHRGYAQHAELRQRKLLLHRHEIRKLVGRTTEKGLDAGAAGAATSTRDASKSCWRSRKGKQVHDKRETIKTEGSRPRDARRREGPSRLATAADGRSVVTSRVHARSA